MQEAHENIQMRVELVTKKAIQVGLWDMVVIAGDPVNPKMNSHGRMNSAECSAFKMSTIFQIY
ncbi:hypothetical protein BsIDN1_69650 [Bacillus safensis]|uniref:Uncharacterized protein n=1 Tax=Bacillus safensis TaxID=561879 RepID=A0A5S9MIU0_BACIA|nr:hypothetical protein BsIDN1_69650 [Bacillus safensis]